jgi:ribosomal protein L37AE/L43A
MASRFECPVCGARQSRRAYERNGCWSCQFDAERQQSDAAFAEFMGKDEEERWRLVWDALLK